MDSGPSGMGGMMKAIDLIKEHEGLRLKPYRCTAGKLTIGYGRNIEDNGIREEEAEYMLRNDIRDVTVELIARLPFFTGLSRERQDALIDMCFNLGITRFIRFKKMLAAIEEKKYTLAAVEMLDSRWAHQVGQRARTLADIMRGD